MPVTFDNAVQGTQTSTLSLTVSLTVASNACLVVSVGTGGVGKSISGVQANNTALTQYARAQDPNGNAITLWVLTAAPSGTVSISAAIVGAAAVMDLKVASYIGQKAINPFGTAITGSGNAVTNSVISLSTSTTDIVVWAVIANNDASATNATQRLVLAPNLGSFLADTAGSSAAISLSCTYIAAATTCFWGINIAFSAASGTSPPWGLMTMGCGV